MIREESFVLSHRPYAVELDTFTPGADDEDAPGGSAIDTVWFRRYKGVTSAYIGYLWSIQHPRPADAAVFLARYGGDREHGYVCRGRWDGARYRGSSDPDVAAAHLEILRPMLENYPACPNSYCGWWRF